MNKSQMLCSAVNKQKIGEKAKENEKPKVFTLKKYQSIGPKVVTKQNKGENPNDIEKKNQEDLQIIEKYFDQNK